MKQSPHEMKNTIALIALFIFLAGAGFAIWAVNTPAARAGRHQEAADSYLLKKDFPKAIQELEESQKIQPSRDTQFALGVTYMRAGQKDKAISVMSELAQENDRVGRSAQKLLPKLMKNNER